MVLSGPSGKSLNPNYAFDYFSTTVLSDDGGLFLATYTGSDEQSIFDFRGNCSQGFKVSEM
eukprot:85330-Pyramimonas_sp.AAC.1